MRRCRFPVFLGYGDLTVKQEEIRVGIMAQLFPDVRVRRFGGIHHFVSPQELYNPDHVKALHALWSESTTRGLRDERVGVPDEVEAARRV